MIVDESLLPLFEKVGRTSSIEHVIVTSAQRRRPEAARDRLRLRSAHRGGRSRRRFVEPAHRRARRGGDVLHVGHDRPSEGRAVLASCPGAAFDSRRACVAASGSATTTRSCRSCRCFTSTRGGCRSAARCSAATRCCRARTSTRRASPELLGGERVTLTAGVPTVWLALLQELDQQPGRLRSQRAARRRGRRQRGAAVDDSRLLRSATASPSSMRGA